MARFQFVLLLLIPLLIQPGVSQSSSPTDDSRVDPQVLRMFQHQSTVPVMVSVDGRLSEARAVWREVSRALGGRYGLADSPPNLRGEFFVEVNRFGLMIILGFEPVAEVYLPFEATLPGQG